MYPGSQGNSGVIFLFQFQRMYQSDVFREYCGPQSGFLFLFQPQSVYQVVFSQLSCLRWQLMSPGFTSPNSVIPTRVAYPQNNDNQSYRGYLVILSSTDTGLPANAIHS